MSPFQTARDIGGGIVDALKTSPLVLALIVLNLIFLGFGFYSEISERENSKALVAEILRSTEQERNRWKDLVESAMRWCPAGSYPRSPQQ